jgi:ABC-type Fe3+-hydroxamate transport system substrate-binding protein
VTRPVALPCAPQRIVSLVPSTTESVCAFGAAARLVACTRYCSEPAGELQHTRRIGGTKNPDREAILSLRPDLVLGNAEENRGEDLQWLAERVCVLTRTPRTVHQALADLRELAEVLASGAAAAPWLARAAAAVDALKPVPRPPLRVYYAIWRKPWMTVNADTFVHDVLRLAGADNVAATERERYPVLEPMVAVARGVDVVLLASEPWAFDANEQRELEEQRLFGAARLVRCDGRDFCWHGVRIADGLGRAAALLRTLAR